MSSTPPLSSLRPPHVFRSVSDTSSVRNVSSNGAMSFNPVASGSAGEQFHPPMSFLRRVVSATSPTRSKDATDREKTKELEKKELLAMILESIANVPVAVERIHTNEKLRTALKEEMGAENMLLHRFFDTTQQKQDQHETLKLQQNLSADNLQRWERNRRAVDEEEDEEEEDGQEQSATSLDVYEHYQHSQEEDADSKGSDSESDSSSSGFGSEYENDLAEAVNQLCMTDDALTAMDDMISDPISIANATLGNAGSARVSISPQSSFGLGASPGTASMDGAGMAQFSNGNVLSNEFVETSQLKIQAAVFHEVLEEKLKPKPKVDNVHTVDIKEGDDPCDGEDGSEISDDSHDDGEPKEYEEFQLRIIREKNRTGFEPNQDWRPRAGNVIGGRYKVEMAIGEAVFSRTYKCTDTSTDQAVCLKIIKNNKEYFDQGVDEIRVLDYIDQNCKVDERHLVRLLDYFYFREHLIIVTELLRDNLYEFSRLLLQRGVINYFSIPRLKKITIEVLEALDTLHALGLVHCDLKPENILIQNFSSCTIKVIDFGSACFVTDELTSYVQSRSYRAPEVILGLLYDQKIDLWSLGCVIAEMFTGEVLFRNDSEQTLLARIMTTIGPIPASLLVAREELQSQLIDTGLFTVDQAGNGVLAARLHLPPLEEAVPTKDLEFLEFLRALLQIDPTHRLSARQALAHPWLQHGVFSENRM
ncbi:hypothetical protein BBO99_00002746 [Phytophthora kernoviae]|uniref:Protein kinase domain-containing protein n=2 Tax=Phytophthora kernoviae TaxID=325452 RepID=A0A421GWY6_9STRA|nr:hypothetical protein G195_004165 [Phytophthora kernoviae 00238/432]KAG2526600.1 hypothetical protein JM16_003678 [Phytophthora kernoviae]KAG2528185.1 hypothetical protein JM18_003253 [Phytophthora kernoviae]RLN37168.1 hypothetical protein BBI17_004250 [Phytophthora kernoviae]RLN82661.1 hypothetical protein BBO99_00002746 [Phytophthora kernoviae]